MVKWAQSAVEPSRTIHPWLRFRYAHKVCSGIRTSGNATVWTWNDSPSGWHSSSLLIVHDLVLPGIIILRHNR